MALNACRWPGFPDEFIHVPHLAAPRFAHGHAATLLGRVTPADVRLFPRADLVRGAIGRFLRLPRFERCLLLPAWGLLGAMRAAVLGLGFPRLAPWLGRRVAVPPPSPVLDARAQRRALQIGRTLRLAARHTPWQSNCLAQALSARCLLGLFRVPHVIFFGVARTPQTAQLQAHAWVLAGSVRVTGGGAGRYTPVGCFVVPAGAAR